MASIISELQLDAKKIIQHLEQVFGRISLGRASTGLVEEVHVHISSRGMDQKLSQVANITIMDPQTLKIEPRDKSVLKDVEKAIYDAQLGLSPQNQGDYLIIKIPPLTKERRTEVTKVVARDGEDSKIALRNKRHDARKKAELLHKNEEISENEKNGIENKIDDITKEFNEKIDELVKGKNEEVMKV